MSLTLSLLLSILLLLSCFTLSIGSWLETNDLFSLTSAGHDMAIIRLLLHKKSINKTKALTFGLWKYCIYDIDTGSFACSPVNMKYSPGNINWNNTGQGLNLNQPLDFLSIFQSLTQDQTITDENSSSYSYVRLVPLLVASVLSISTFAISPFLLKFNTKKSIQRCAFLVIIGFLSIITSVICSISLGMTYHSYSSNIKKMCTSVLTSNDDTTDTFNCASYTVKDESILLAVTIGIQAITFICCIFLYSQTRHLAITQQRNEIIPQPPLFLDSTVHSEKTDILYKREKEESARSLSEAELWSEHPTQNTYNTQLSLRPRPTSHQMDLHYAGRRSKEITCHNNSALKTNQGDLITAKIRPNSSDITTNGSLDIYASVSSFSLRDSQLVPPKRPFANENVYNGSGNRPLSYGSDNTFGIIAIKGSDNGSEISSIGHGGPGSNVSSSIIYSTNENPATQSNHTLGTFLTCHTPNIESYYSSVDEDADQEEHSRSGSGPVVDKNTLMIPSNYTYDLPSTPKTLSKRINDYLQSQK